VSSGQPRQLGMLKAEPTPFFLTRNEHQAAAHAESWRL
jgi:hypothetical protein